MFRSTFSHLFSIAIFLAHIFLSPLYGNVQDLSIEEKIGQLLMVHFQGSDCNESAMKLIEKAHVGSFILYKWSNELNSKEQVLSLTQNLQTYNAKHSEIPLFIAIDQEGGKVSRLSSGYNNFPSSRIIGTIGYPPLAYHVAYAQGRQMQASGINVNLAPVVDIVSSSSQSFLKERTFGGSSEEVIRFCEQALSGYENAKIMATLKHFPGHGSVDDDSHASTPISWKNEGQLFQSDIIPFLTLAKKAPAIMTSHILFPNIDPTNICSLSSTFLQSILRQKLKYEGLVISDSLIMKGAHIHSASLGELACMALQAGSDIVCLGGRLLDSKAETELNATDILGIHSYIVTAVKEKKINEALINNKVERVLAAKNQYSKKTKPLTDEETTNFALLEQEIALTQKLQLLSKQELDTIASRIFTNETSGNVDKLIHWNRNENFASLGIGHFIWYPEEQEKKYREGFVDFLQFCCKERVSLPSILQERPSCLWKSMEELKTQKYSKDYTDLHQWLLSTFDLQAKYIIHSKTIDICSIIDSCANTEEKTFILNTLTQLTATSEGLFAVIDYLNFKGTGLDPRERHQNNGWGLYQVLIKMKDIEGTNTMERFQNACIYVLNQRVQLSPQKEVEKGWLKGWINRIEKYNK